MSEPNDIEKILAKADKLKFLGQNRAFVTILFAIWANRKRGWLARILRLVFLAAGAGGYGYLVSFFA